MSSAAQKSQYIIKSWADQVPLGKYLLKNRIVLSALTRQRCDIGVGIPNDLLVKYYGQRSGAGLIFTESASWSQRGEAFPGAASLYTKEQAEGWKKVINKIHENNSRIYVQLNHCGRASFKCTNGGLQTWAPSPIKIRDLHSWLKTEH